MISKTQGEIMLQPFFKQILFSLFFFSLSGFLGFASHASQSINTKEVVINIGDAFIPGGFDSEADSFVVISGIFPNGCYRWKNAEVRNINTFEHEVTAKAEVSQGMCIMALIPYSQEVRLGKLDSGKHLLRFLNGDGTYTQKDMQIE